jgi:hypothetical protein
MLKRLLCDINSICGSRVTGADVAMCIACAGYVRKGQQQMMADYLMLELVEQGRL